MKPRKKNEIGNGHIPVFSCPSSRLTGTPFPYREVEEEEEEQWRWQYKRGGEKQWGPFVSDTKKNSVWKLDQEGERVSWGWYRWNSGAVASYVATLCVCDVSSGECVLFCPFRSQGTAGPYPCHPTFCDLSPIPTGHPHRATDAYSLV